MKSHPRISIASRGVRLGLVVLLSLVMGGVEGRSTSNDETLDPLTMPRPELSTPLILPLDERAPVEKIVSTMAMAVRRLEDPSSLRVIVSLHEPMVDARSTSASAKAERLAQIANVEHDFVEGAGRLGFRPLRGLSNFAIVSGEISPERLIHLAALRQVKAIEPDRVLRANTAEGLPLVKSNQLQSRFGLNGDGITVVVLDSGINAGHPDLAGRVVEARTFNGPPGDGFNHGTKVAGIIAGQNGAASNAVLWDIKVLDNGGNTTIDILLAALNDLSNEMDSFQILVGAFSDPTLRFSSSCDGLNPAATQVINAFRDAGKLLIGSTGNDADGAGIGIPACLDAILATGAVYDANFGSVSFGGCTDSTTAADKIACYSNGGPLVDFYAPGHCTRSPQAGGGFDSCFGGTSPSAAYVAGVAAQIWGGKPDLTAANITNALKSTGPNLNDPRSGISRRRIDGEAAYESLGGEEEPTPTPPGPTPTKTATVQGPGPSPTPTKTATVVPGGVPAAPTNLTAAAVSHTAVLLEWNDNSNNETSFRIERKTGGGAFTEVGTAPANVRFIPVEGLAPSTSNDFRVRARNGSQNSGFTNVASATTPAATAACVQDANTACLLGGKFRITGEMKNFATPPVIFPLQVMDFPGGRAESDQASFWQSFAVGNFEIAIKATDACGLPLGHPLRFYWAFFGGLTDKKTDMTIMDTVTGATLTFHNPPNTFPTTIANTMAFPCVNPGAQGACTANATTACLIGGRFKVTGSMEDANQQVFTTQVMNFPNAVSIKPRARAETDQSAFFQSFDVGNFEIGVKMLDACTLPPGHPLRFSWIFYGGLTNAATEVRAVHTTSGNVDIWRNPSGTVPTTEGRTMAFPCP